MLNGYLSDYDSRCLTHAMTVVVWVIFPVTIGVLRASNIFVQVKTTAFNKIKTTSLNHFNQKYMPQERTHEGYADTAPKIFWIYKNILGLHCGYTPKIFTFVYSLPINHTFICKILYARVTLLYLSTFHAFTRYTVLYHSFAKFCFWLLLEVAIILN